MNFLMTKSVLRRSKELAWDVTSIGNFNYAKAYGDMKQGFLNKFKWNIKMKDTL